MLSRITMIFGAAFVAASFPVAVFANDGTRGLQAGGAIAVTPKFEGSKDYEIRGFPIVAPAGSGGAPDAGPVQFRGVDDIRFRVVNFLGLEMGPLAGYRFGRDENDADRLIGLGDIDGGLVVGAYAAFNFGAFKPFVSYHHQVTGDDSGGLVRFGAETRMPLAMGIALTVVAGASYATEEYNDAYFTVTDAQALTSVAHLAAYDAEAGIKDVYLSLGTDIPLSDVWSLKLGGRYARLLGDAADSPIVETENQFSGVVGLTYKFSVPR